MLVPIFPFISAEVWLCFSATLLTRSGCRVGLSWPAVCMCVCACVCVLGRGRGKTLTNIVCTVCILHTSYRKLTKLVRDRQTNRQTDTYTHTQTDIRCGKVLLCPWDLFTVSFHSVIYALWRACVCVCVRLREGERASSPSLNKESRCTLNPVLSKTYHSLSSPLLCPVLLPKCWFPKAV